MNYESRIKIRNSKTKKEEVKNHEKNDIGVGYTFDS